jgi:hypothetical protein
MLVPGGGRSYMAGYRKRVFLDEEEPEGSCVGRLAPVHAVLVKVTF